MKYVILVAMIGILAYELFVLVKTIIAKRKAKNVLETLKQNKESDEIKVL